MLDWLTEHNDVLPVYGSLVIATVEVGLLAWRAWSADRQVKSLQEQIALGRQDSLANCFQQAANMLGSGVLSSRTGGVYSLKRLAEDHAEEYHVQVMELLCAFVRSPPLLDLPPDGFREDVHAALQAMGHRSDVQMKIEQVAGFRIDLSGASLSGEVVGFV